MPEERESCEVPAIGIVLDQIAEAADYIWMQHWAEANAGNITVNVTSILDSAQLPIVARRVELPRAYPSLAGQLILATITGSRMRDIADDPADGCMLLHIEGGGEVYRVLAAFNASGRPTSELASHLLIHEMLLAQGSPLRTVVHTHPPELVALTHVAETKPDGWLNDALWAAHAEVKIFFPEGVGYVPYLMPGSEALAQATVEALRTHPVVVWVRHGALALGENPLDAFDALDTLNKAADIWLKCSAAGVVPYPLSKAELAELGSYLKKLKGE
jgi:rhamnulose-1-phosphate aldolase